MSFSDKRYESEAALVKRITASILNDHVAHAYIIEGDKLTDKEGFALDFIKAIICKDKPGIGCDSCSRCRKVMHGNFEDLNFVKAELNSAGTNKSVRDENIEKLLDRISIKASNDRSFAVISDADSMTIRAQNRLLKTLEEPPKGALMILLSENREKLLQTIRSRCITYRLYTQDIRAEAAGETYQPIASSLNGADAFINLVLNDESFFEVKTVISKYAHDKEQAELLLEAIEVKLRNVMLENDDRYRRMKRDRVIRAIELTEEAKRDLKANVNYGYALKNLFIKMSR